MNFIVTIRTNLTPYNTSMQQDSYNYYTPVYIGVHWPLSFNVGLETYLSKH